jgi:signal transduction histidine kinase
VRAAEVGSLRVAATPFRDAWLVVAEPLAPIDANVSSLRDTMLLTLPALLLSLGSVVWLAVGRALRPVTAAIEREERLLGDASHELRSPIAGMRVLLETEPDDPGEARHNRRRVLASLRRLEAITDQLLQLTRSEQRVRRRARPVDLDEIVERAAQRIATSAACEIDVTGVAAGQVLGDEADLESLVDNLLGNAVRHARRGVRVTLTEEAGSIRLTVEDDGSGIPAEARAQVFERFTRLDEARTRDSGGAGLGLAIVKGVVDAHGGSIVVTDSPLGGARFVVTLPSSLAPEPVTPLSIP